MLYAVPFLFILIVLLFPIQTVMISSGMKKYYNPLSSFSIKWMHSVEKEDWIESYKTTKDGFLLYESTFKTFGAGVPSEGEVVKKYDDWVTYRIHRNFEQLNIVVSKNVHSTLLVDGKNVPLFKLFPSYSEVRFQKERIPVIFYLMNRLP
ncbi:MAG: DUF1850 domain-containing protein [Heyndrickxia sp.]